MKPGDNAKNIQDWKTRDNSYWLQERLCDYAAAELTMPQPLFDECMAAGATIRELADIFQVSEMMVAVRMSGVEELKIPSIIYDINNPVAFIAGQLERGKPIAIVWAPNDIKACCRKQAAQDVIGVPHIFGIRESPALSTVSGLEKHGKRYIPYMLTGYGVPAELECDERCVVEVVT